MRKLTALEKRFRDDDLEWRVMDAEASRAMWVCIAGLGWMLFGAALLVIWRGLP